MSAAIEILEGTQRRQGAILKKLKTQRDHLQAQIDEIDRRIAIAESAGKDVESTISMIKEPSRKAGREAR